MKPVLIVLGLLLALPASAQTGSVQAGPAQAVDAFHDALREGDRARALAWLHPQLQVFEQGHIDWTREDYARNHLAADLKAARALHARRLRREVLALGPENAAVMTESEIGEPGPDGQAPRVATETMLLVRTAGKWRIRHIHWSSRRRSAP